MYTSVYNNGDRSTKTKKAKKIAKAVGKTVGVVAIGAVAVAGAAALVFLVVVAAPVSLPVCMFHSNNDRHR